MHRVSRPQVPHRCQRVKIAFPTFLRDGVVRGNFRFALWKNAQKYDVADFTSDDVELAG